MRFTPLLPPLCLASVLVAATPHAVYANRLKDEQSPYLLQHAANPVDWFPWGDEAFIRAKKNRQLIFLSIGYSTCHWCHVMEQESFEDEEVAKHLNRDFVSIKVDREERPDIDQFYMQVATRLTGQGGWPLTIIMTPDKIPLFAATYIPKQGRMGRPGLMEILPRIAEAWADHPADLERDARQFLKSIEEVPNRQDFSFDLVTRAVDQMRGDFDKELGGFGRAPKFPRPHQLAFLLQRYQLDGDKRLLEMVETTLAAMRNGGIYDQLGFGFHRYSTDRQWLLPHFEKMLYDQAGLAEVYLQAYALTGKQEYADTSREIFEYLMHRMRSPQGGYYSAEDADTEGAEGLTYLWRHDEVIELLGKKPGERFSLVFNIRQNGNFTHEVGGENHDENIPHQSRTFAQWATDFHMEPAQLARELEASRKLLLEQRNLRPQPFLDDKVLTAWNTMLISALSIGARILNDDGLKDEALSVHAFIGKELSDAKGKLLRRWRQGKAAIPAFGEDYAWLARAELDLYRLTLDQHYLKQALKDAETLFDQFGDNATIYTGAAGSELPQRTSERYDGATPSTPSVALEVAGRLAQLTGENRWKDAAEDLLQGATHEVKRYPQGFPHLLAAAERLGPQARELVVIGQRHDPATDALLAAAGKADELTSLVLVEPDTHEDYARLVPLTREMRMIDDQPTAYLCSGQSCGAPMTSASELEERLSERTRNGG